MSLSDVTEVQRDAISQLRSASTIRERCENIFSAALDDRLQHFEVDLSRLSDVASRVAMVTRRDYADLDLPVHSRWRHFEVGKVDRLEQLRRRLASRSSREQARSHVDLVVTSVLLDAGAGASWTFRDRDSGQIYSRSEGLAVASHALFVQGGFSSVADDPYRADADCLENVREGQLIDAFQVTDVNPLTGLEGRVSLLRALGAALVDHPEIFGAARPRVGNLVDYFSQRTEAGAPLAAATVLRTILDALDSIWPSGLKLFGVNVGDVGRHPEAGGSGVSAGYVPFHKLSQWLTYSLIEPLAVAGIDVSELDALTGLPEYRNGGLLVDGGVLKPRHAGVTGEEHECDAEVVVEWRGLTVALLDRLRDVVAQDLGVHPSEFPLARLLQGGTWQAGRELARERRSDGGPPIRIRSDGTVF